MIKYWMVLVSVLSVACGPSKDSGSSTPTPGPTAAETLCWDTSGAWVNGACDCVQDGASWNYVFDPIDGCGPATDLEELCWNTGGAWEGYACECAQDGATLYHTFDQTLGCVPGDMVAIENLCWSTGGAWDNGACECAQDGATLNHIFDVHVGCRAPSPN